jgi:hypothetical protein
LKALLRPLLLATAVAAEGCGGDNPSGPGADPPAGLRFDDFQAASHVIGQPDMKSGLSNAGGTTGRIGLVQPPSAGGGDLYVPDPWNHRVLGFVGIPATDGTPADFVLGQPDFTSSSSGTGPQTFQYPSDCCVDGGKLFVVDSGNRRVLIWNTLPLGDVPADVVVGQADFTSVVTGVTSSTNLGPANVTAAGGKLIVSDTANHRVLIWSPVPTGNGVPASVVLGQDDFTTAAPGLSSTRFRSPTAVWTDGTRLVVGDLENRRVLIWNEIPTRNGAPADVVVGADDFTSAGSTVASARSFGFPQGVASDGVSLFVADPQNNRVLIFVPFPSANGATATGVLGQASFTGAASNDAGQDGVPDQTASARTMFTPRGLAVIGDRLLVADLDNHRLLVFDGRR